MIATECRANYRFETMAKQLFPSGREIGYENRGQVLTLILLNHRQFIEIYTNDEMPMARWGCFGAINQVCLRVLGFRRSHSAVGLARFVLVDISCSAKRIRF